jgi:hypothetical protein
MEVTNRELWEIGGMKGTGADLSLHCAVTILARRVKDPDAANKVYDDLCKALIPLGQAFISETDPTAKPVYEDVLRAFVALARAEVVISTTEGERS